MLAIAGGHAIGGSHTASIGIVQVGADQRLHASISTRGVELHQAEQIGVIRKRHRRHAKLRHPLRQIAHLGQPVAQRILAVDGQVDEPGPVRDGINAFGNLVAGLVRNGRRDLDILDFDDFAHGCDGWRWGRLVYPRRSGEGVFRAGNPRLAGAVCVADQTASRPCALLRQTPAAARSRASR